MSDATLEGKKHQPKFKGRTLVISHLTFAGLELGCHREEPLVLDVEFGVELGEDEDLGAPVLCVRRPVLQAEQAEASGRKGQAAETVAPLLLGPEVDNGGWRI